MVATDGVRAGGAQVKSNAGRGRPPRPRPTHRDRDTSASGMDLGLGLGVLPGAGRTPNPGPRTLTSRFAPLLFVLLSACSAGAADAPVTDAPLPVRTASVRDTMLAPVVRGTGLLGADDERRLGFKIGGVIARVLVEEGDAVRAGEPLAVLDLAEIDAAVRKAESAAAKARRDAERAERLHADSVATLAQLQDARTGLEVSQADVATARFNRRFATIVAPAAGTVLRRLAEPGELVAPGTPVLVLGARGAATTVTVALPDRDVVRVRRGDRAQVTVDALDAPPIAGRVSAIAAAPDAMTGTYAVEITLDARATAGRTLPTGLVAHAEIRSRDARPARVIPVEALLEADGDRATVFTVSGDGTRAERRAVTVGAMRGAVVPVLAGLEGTGVVVTDGAAELHDGRPVRRVP